MKFITFRRYYLDRLLSETFFFGDVLDVGGKRANPRGNFRPPMAQVRSWRYLNIDASTDPDYLCSADHIASDSRSFDMIIMIEVLEHIKNPECALQEASRVIKQGGMIVMTMPFLHALHNDPGDFQRWTPAKIDDELEKVGFCVIDMRHMGGIVAVILDLIYARTATTHFISKMVRALIRRTAHFFIYLDSRIHSGGITTGFYVKAKKIL